jgi:ankyrin repeat protein
MALNNTIKINPRAAARALSNSTIKEFKPKLTKLTDSIIKDSLRLICYCKEKNFIAAKELLCSKFIDLELQDDCGCSAFHYACIYEDKGLWSLLLNKYLFPHLMEEYIFHEVENFIRLQEKNDNKTILHYISEKNLIEFYNKLEFYFPKNINHVINYSTLNGDTALHLACGSANNLVLKKILVTPNVEINQTNQQGNTALHLACENNNLTLTKQLLLHPQINVNIKNSAGNTPLHQVCKSQHYGSGLMVKELLKMASINLFLKNNQQLSALALAEEQNCYEIKALITQAQMKSPHHLF